mgnify:CR=1 FL=1
MVIKTFLPLELWKGFACSLIANKGLTRLPQRGKQLECLRKETKRKNFWHWGLKLEKLIKYLHHVSIYRVQEVNSKSLAVIPPMHLEIHWRGRWKWPQYSTLIGDAGCWRHVGSEKKITWTFFFLYESPLYGSFYIKLSG